MRRRSRRPLAPGERARNNAVFGLALAAGAGVIAAGAYLHDSDLRDTRHLADSTGTVVREVGHAKRAPELIVRWEGPDGRVRQVAIPYDDGWHRVSPGTPVALLYRPDDVSRVRTKTGWQPAGEVYAFQAGLFAVFALICAGVGVIKSRRARKRNSAEALTGG